MSAARRTLRKQASVSSGVPNYNSQLFRGAFVQTNSQIAGRQVRIAAGLIKIQNDIDKLFAQDLRGPPGPQGEPGYVNVNYNEDIADEFPVFSVHRLSSHWTLSDSNDRQIDISTNSGFMVLGGLYSDQDSPVAYPIYDPSTSKFIPMNSSSYQKHVPITTTELPNYTEIPFHTNRIIQDISWECPTGIAARFAIIGKPNSGSNYYTKYYQIQGEKIFEEIPMGNTFITTDRRNPTTENQYNIPLANTNMPQMKSLAVILFDIRYVPSGTRDTYSGSHSSLLKTTSTPSSEKDILTKGISIRFVCKNHVTTS